MRKIFIFLMLAAGNAVAQTGPAITDYINKYSQLAIEEQVRTGIPAAITLAQGIHESGAGLGDLALRSNNHFGIKCKTGWEGDKVFHDDDERGECFRAYGCVADSYIDHSDFLVNGKRYSFLFDMEVKSYKGWAYGLKKAGYATNPKYPEVLIRIIEENGLSSYTDLALLREKQADAFTAASKSNKDEPFKVIPAVVKEKSAPVEVKTAVVTEQQKPKYKPGIFTINDCKVMYVEEGMTLTQIASKQNIPLKKLLEYNDIQSSEQLGESPLVYLEPKKKKGANETHQVRTGESAWMISQQEGIQLKRLLQQNRLSTNSSLKPGQVLYLHDGAPRS
jgi:LysM repeat protein